MRTPLTVIAALLVALLALSFVTEDDDDGAPTAQAAPLPVIADRVEALRELRFEELPNPVEVTPGEAREEALEQFDETYSEPRLRAEEELYKLLELIEPAADLRELAGSLFGEGVAGYYDPRDGRLRIVTGAGTGTRVLSEIVLAHELTHALEDQRFELEDDLGATDDLTLARSAFIEGTATALMYAYVQEHFTTEETLGGLLGSAFQDTGDLPPFLESQVVFPYVGGERFVRELIRRADGRWTLVDTAFRLRRPSSTEQILHPAAYFDADEPERVRLRVGAVLGDAWTRAHAGTWGEFQTRELLSRAGGGASDAAAGWGGDRYELWRARGVSGDEHALIMRWRWDTPRDEEEFAERLEAYAESELGGRAVVVRRPGAVTLVLAPSATLAERLGRNA